MSMSHTTERGLMQLILSKVIKEASSLSLYIFYIREFTRFVYILHPGARFYETIEFMHIYTDRLFGNIFDLTSWALFLLLLLFSEIGSVRARNDDFFEVY